MSPVKLYVEQTVHPRKQGDDRHPAIHRFFLSNPFFKTTDNL
jgi:hypothetical protein